MNTTLRTRRALPTIDDAETLPGLLVARARTHPDRVAFRQKDLGIWQEITWATYLDEVIAIAYGLRDLGVESGDRVAIHAENRPEWVFADLAAESLGAIVVGVYPTNPAAEVEYMLRDSGAKVLIAEDQEQVDKALAVVDDCPELRSIVVIDPKGLRGYDHPMLIDLVDVIERGRQAAGIDPNWFEEAIATISSDDVSCIVYTSGTTGAPKGAMLTHRNCLVGARAFVDGMGVNSNTTTVSYLPLCHVAERIWSIFISLLAAPTINFAESVDTVQSDIHEIAPTFFGAVPRIAEKMQAGVEIKTQDASRLKRFNYALWMRVGRSVARERLENSGELGLISRLKYQAGNLFLYRALRDRLGLRNVEHCLVGAAPPSPELLEYFHAMGVAMVQTYGQTECGGSSHLHHGWDIAYDSVGTVLPGYECRLDPDTNEVLLRGDGLFAGYWRNEEATADTIRNGWLHTGDQGTITDRGHLKIVGRLKDIIITSGGKNVSPDFIENEIKFSPYVREAIIVGDGRKYVAALIGIEYDTVGHWAEQHGIAYTTYRDLSERDEVFELIADWVKTVNEKVAQVEQVKKFTLLTKELDHEDAELTATQKVRRSAIMAKFHDAIEELYR